MKLINILFFIILLIFYNSLYSQTYSTIHGFVLDKDNEQPLFGTNIILLGTDFGSAADSSGYFYIDFIPPGKYDIKVTRIGYESQIKQDIFLKAGEKLIFNFKLIPRVIPLNQVQVEAKRFSDRYETEVARIGLQTISPRQILSMPGAFDDPTRAVQILKSATPVSDFNSFFAIRGGSPDQNLIIMDGVVIPNPYRFRIAMGGGMSIFDPNITKEVRLHVGGFSAEFGNLLSSVLEVDTRAGNNKRVSIKSSLNMLDAGIVIEGPLYKHKGSWLFSARRTYYDLVANRFVETNSTFPNSSDINAKFVYNFTDKSQLSIHYMRCAEKTKLLAQLAEDVDLSENSKINLLIINWKHAPTEKLTYQTTFSYYRDDWKAETIDPLEPASDPAHLYESLNMKTSNVAFKEDVEYRISERFLFRRGFSYSSIRPVTEYLIRERPFIFTRRDTPGQFSYNERENYLAGYGEITLKLTQQFQTKIGLRYDYSTLIEKGELSPRFSTWYQINSKTIIKGFYGRCYQYPNIMSTFYRDRAIILATNIDDLKAELADHYTIGITRKLDSNYSVNLDFYYKHLDQLLLPQSEETSIAENTGQGFSKGIELLVEKRQNEKSKISGFLTYSYGNARYNDGNWIPFNFDRRHGVSFFCMLNMLRNFKLTLLWRIASGLPYTAVSGIFLPTHYDNREFLRESRNACRFPTYQRLDLRLNYSYRSNNRVFSMYIDLINIYNHKNVYDQIWQLSSMEKSDVSYYVVRMRTLYMLPFLPSIGISFKL